MIRSRLFISGIEKGSVVRPAQSAGVVFGLFHISHLTVALIQERKGVFIGTLSIPIFFHFPIQIQDAGEDKPHRLGMANARQGSSKERSKLPAAERGTQPVVRSNLAIWEWPSQAAVITGLQILLEA